MGLLRSTCGLGLVVWAIVRYQEARSRARAAALDPAVRAALEELRETVEALRNELAQRRDDGERLLELEERVDFAERLLARRGDQARLPEGG